MSNRQDGFRRDLQVVVGLLAGYAAYNSIDPDLVIDRFVRWRNAGTTESNVVGTLATAYDKFQLRMDLRDFDEQSPVSHDKLIRFAASALVYSVASYASGFLFSK